MHESANNDYFWVYIVAAIIFTGAAYFMSKIIRVWDKSADRFVEKKVKRTNDDQTKTKNRYKTF